MVLQSVLKVIFTMIAQFLVCTWMLKLERGREVNKIIRVLRDEYEKMSNIFKVFEEITTGMLPYKGVKVVGIRKVILISVLTSALIIESLIIYFTFVNNFFVAFLVPYFIILIAIVFTTAYKVLKCATGSVLCDMLYIKYVHIFLALIVGWCIGTSVSIVTSMSFYKKLFAIVAIADGIALIPMIVGISYLYNKALYGAKRWVLTNYEKDLPIVEVYTDVEKITGKVKNFLDKDFLVLTESENNRLILIPWKQIKRLKVIE